MARRVYAENKQYESLDCLKKAIEREWENLPNEMIHSLLQSMPDRIFECIKAEGAYTKF